MAQRKYLTVNLNLLLQRCLQVYVSESTQHKGICNFFHLNNVKKFAFLKPLAMDIHSPPRQAGFSGSPCLLLDTFPPVQPVFLMLPSYSVSFSLTDHVLERSYGNSLFPFLLAAPYIIKDCCQMSSASSSRHL